MTKIKEWILDIRMFRKPVTPVSVQGVYVGIVGDYKYLEAHMDNKLDWVKNSTVFYRKSRLYFLRRLRSF